MPATMKSALLKLHIAVFLWGFTGLLGRLISLNEGLLVWYRMLITVVSLLVLMMVRGQLRRVPARNKWQLFGIGALIAMHWVFFFGSIKYSNVSIALTCMSSTALFTSLMEPLLSKKKIVPQEIALGLLAVAGIYLIFHFDPQYKTGIVLGLTSTLLCAIFSILNKKQVEQVAPRTMMVYELGGGVLFLTLLMPLYLQAFPPATLLPTAYDVVWLLVLSWLCTILAMDLSLQALKSVTAFTQTLTLNLEPVYGILLAFAVYSENQHLSQGFYVGFMLILLAVLLQMFRVVRYHRKQPHLFGVEG